jgi:release factor glutamine methyltransferase
LSHRALLRRLLAPWWAAQHWALKQRYNRLRLEQHRGVPLLMLPGVFNGVLMRSGALLADALDEHFPADISTALDLGTGSGIGAIFAARRAARVIAVDINPTATRNAQINAQLNSLESRLETRWGDLFAPVTGQTFDLILFNPPFYRGEPRDDLDRAWRATDVFERFARGLRAALAPNGQAWIVLSDLGAGAELLALLRAQGFKISQLARRDFLQEVLTVYVVS